EVAQGALLDPVFRRGFAHLAARGLTFDAWVYHTQLADVVDLARAFPYTTIILDHAGGPVGVGPFAGKRDEVFAQWRTSLREVAACANVVVKLGGLGLPVMGFGFDRRAQLPASPELADAWRPYIETCIAGFGVSRCMFQSNFPPDRESCSYASLWNAFKRVTAGCSSAERAALFHDNAARIYRLAPAA
ncbi:MAG: amidohydrolase family protein, partial [Casimicrobiaceae bacterium]